MDRRTIVVVVAATLAGCALRLADLTGTSLTHDEAYSLWVVGDVSRVAARLATDGHPPLWYAFLAGWTWLFGGGDLAGRLSSVAAGIALVPLTAIAGRRLFDAATARWAAVLVAVWPMLVIEQRDVRMYAWLPVALVAAILVEHRARVMGRRLDRALFGASLAVLAAIHHFGAVIAAALFAGAAVSSRDRRGLVLSAAVAAVLYAPVAILLVFLVRTYLAGGSKSIGPGSLLQLVTGLTVGPIERGDPALLVAGAAFVLAAVAIGLRRAAPHRAVLGVTLLFGTAVPVVLAAWVFAFPPAPRYFTGVTPILALAAARFAATARAPAAHAHALAVVAVLVAGSVATLTSNAAVAADWRGLAATVARESRGESIVYVAPAYFLLAYERYSTGGQLRSVPDVAAAPPEFPRPTTAELRIAVDAPEAHWLLIADWLLAEEPEIAATLDARAVEVPTGWWMRAFRVPAR